MCVKQKGEKTMGLTEMILLSRGTYGEREKIEKSS